MIGLLPARWLDHWLGECERARHVNVLVSSMLILGGLCWVGADSFPARCVVRLLTGHLCPFCGMTHAVAALARGDLREAWAFHPGGVLQGLVLAVQLPLRVAALAGWIDLPWRRAVRWESAAAMALGLVCGIVFIVRALPA